MHRWSQDLPSPSSSDSLGITLLGWTSHFPGSMLTSLWDYSRRCEARSFTVAWMIRSCGLVCLKSRVVTCSPGCSTHAWLLVHLVVALSIDHPPSGSCRRSLCLLLLLLSWCPELPDSRSFVCHVAWVLFLFSFPNPAISPPALQRVESSLCPRASRFHSDVLGCGLIFTHYAGSLWWTLPSGSWYPSAPGSFLQLFCW